MFIKVRSSSRNTNNIVSVFLRGLIILCLTRASVCLIFIFLSFSVYAEPQHIEIDIQGIKYELVLTENEQVSPSGEEEESEAHGIYYKGHVAGQSDGWVRASVIDGRWQGVVSVHNAMHMFEYSDSRGANTLSAVSAIDSTPLMQVASVAGTCGSGDGPHSVLSHVQKMGTVNDNGNMISDSSPAPVAATFTEFCDQEVNGVCVIAEVEIAFDLVFQNVFGAQATAQAMSILNIVDGHYLNDLRISIDAITVEMLADDLFNTSVAANPVLNAGDILTDIENKKNNSQIPFIMNNSALTHLVTGRVFDGGSLGVAYSASVCQANGLALAHQVFL